MARRSIEMHEYRQALMRLRQGDSEREIARSGLMGRAKAARFRTQAQAQGWLEPSRPRACRPRPSRPSVPTAPSSRAGSARASPAWRSTPRWCASTASLATTPASAA